MPSPLDLLRKSAGNPAWLRAKIAERSMRIPEDAPDMRRLSEWLAEREAQTGALDPEISFILRRNVERATPRRELQEGEQLRLPGFDKGGKVSESREQKLAREMSHPYSGPKPVDIIPALRRGVQSWVPDLLAIPGDIADGATYLAKRAAGQRNPQSSGLGALTRQKVRERMGISKPRDQVELSDPNITEPGAEGVEGFVQAMNPLFFMNPTKAAGLSAMMMGAPEAGGMLGTMIPKQAKNLGFHTPVFHGTMVPSIEGDVLSANRDIWATWDRLLGPHVAKDPRLTEAFTVGEYAKNSNPPWVRAGDPSYLWLKDRYGDYVLNEGGNTIPLTIRGKYRKVKGDSQTDELRDLVNQGYDADPEVFASWLQRARNFTPEGAERAVRSFERGDTVTPTGKGDIYDFADLVEVGRTDSNYAPRRFALRSTGPVGLDMSRSNLGFALPGYERASDMVRDFDAYGYGLVPAERRRIVDSFKKRLDDEGYSGVEYQNTSGNEVKEGVDPTSYIITNPSAIRSIFAKFDPAKVNDAGLGLKDGGPIQLPTAPVASWGILNRTV